MGTSGANTVLAYAGTHASSLPRSIPFVTDTLRIRPLESTTRRHLLTAVLEQQRMRDQRRAQVAEEGARGDGRIRDPAALGVRQRDETDACGVTDM